MSSAFELRSGAPYIAMLMPYGELRSLAMSPTLPERARVAVTDAMRMQQTVRGVMPYDTQVSSIRGALSYEDCVAERFAVPDGPVRDAIAEVIAGHEFARATYNEEALEAAEGRLEVQSSGYQLPGMDLGSLPY